MLEINEIKFENSISSIDDFSINNLYYFLRENYTGNSYCKILDDSQQYLFSFNQPTNNNPYYLTRLVKFGYRNFIICSEDVDALDTLENLVMCINGGFKYERSTTPIVLYDNKLYLRDRIIKRLDIENQIMKCISVLGYSALTILGGLLTILLISAMP